jgi:membrane protein DedA with SNARE-associated domain
VEDLAHQILAFGASLYESIANLTAVDSDSIRRLALEYGHYIYLLIFLWTFFEGETCVIIAGVVASQDYLEWTPLFLVAWFGSFSGDQLYFWIGRRWGVRLLDRIPRWRPGVELALDFLRRYNTTFILSFRFIYGVRNFASFAMGMSGLDPLRFAALNFFAAFVWALSFAGFGYLFGEALEPFLDNVVLISLAVMAAFFVGAYVLVTLLRRRHRREAERLAAAASAVAATSSTNS